jgi:formylmethanofuran dehydrogenase subunit E
MTPEDKAREDLMILHLRQAIEHGFTMATPGASEAVRLAFPDLFATAAECAGVETSNELELDDHPMVSRGDGEVPEGAFVNAWVWVTYPVVTCDECGAVVVELIGCPDGRELCTTCFEAGVG